MAKCRTGQIVQRERNTAAPSDSELVKGDADQTPEAPAASFSSSAASFFDDAISLYLRHTGASGTEAAHFTAVDANGKHLHKNGTRGDGLCLWHASLQSLSDSHVGQQLLRRIFGDEEFERLLGLPDGLRFPSATTVCAFVAALKTHEDVPIRDGFASVDLKYGIQSLMDDAPDRVLRLHY